MSRLTLARCVRMGMHLLLAIGIFALTGCVSQSSEGQTSRFSYALWVPTLVFLGGMVALPAGFVLRRATARVGWGLMIAGPILAIVLAPTFLFEKITVTPDGFDVASGIFGKTAGVNVKFAEIEQIRITQEMTKGRGARMVDVLICDRRGGGEVARFQLNNDVKLAAAPAIFDRAEERGVRVLDTRPPR